MSSENNLDLQSAFKLLLGALFGLALGGLCGAFYLVTLPVKGVTDLPDVLEPGQKYVLKGRSGGGDAWRLKANELQSGDVEVAFLETELNRWASSFKTEYPDEKPALYIEPQRPLFRLDGDKLLLSATADSGFGSWDRTLMVSMEGDFLNAAGIFKMEPEELFVGSFRVPPFAKDFVWKQLSAGYVIDEEFQSLWESIQSANVQESQLILTAKK
jgi:hypothetical protein